MSKYIDANLLLRKEIERQRQFIEGLFTEGDNSFYDGQDDAYCYILAFLAFLDSIQEQPVERLEEEIKNFFNGWRDDDEYREAVMPDGCCAGVDDCKDIARHFAEWGKNNLK